MLIQKISIQKNSTLKKKIKLFKSCNNIFANKNIIFRELENAIQVSPSQFEKFIQSSAIKDDAGKQNLSLAIAVAKFLNISDKELIEGLKTLPRLALRMEIFEGINQNTVINDTYNADLDALTQSLEYQLSISNGRSRTLILATDSLDEGEKRKLTEIVKDFKLDNFYLIEKNEIPPLSKIKNEVVLIKGTRVAQIERVARMFELKKHKTRIEINLSALKNNLDFWRNSIEIETRLLVMVKASSYGAGAEKIAEFLEKNGVHYLGVAYIDEGIELRKYGIKLPILVMNVDEDGFDDMIENQLEPSLFSFSILDSFTKKLVEKSIENYPIHLKIDTGMRRLGFETFEVEKILEFLQAQPEIKVESVYTHLAETDNFEDQEFTKNQLQKFEYVCTFFKENLSYTFLRHALNSEGICRFKEHQFEMVRLGIGLYGISNNPEIQEKISPVIQWKSNISQIKKIAIGESVGYNRSFIAQKETTIAIIPVGYADGFSRFLSNKIGGMYIKGEFCPVLGNVCMDMTILDVSNIHVKEGEEVEIIGQHQKIENFAKMMNTIPYEVLTSLSKRLPRIYLES
jgi:Alr-MurF fusion protein